MPLTSEQRQRVLANIASGRLPLDPPSKMFAGYGDGHRCVGCEEVIERSHIEYESVYPSGEAYRMHLGCANLWDIERRRQQSSSVSEDGPSIRAMSQETRERARETSKESARLRDQADLLAREAEAVIEESERVKRGEQP